VLDGINKTLTPLLRGTMAAGMTRVLALTAALQYLTAQSCIDAISLL